MNLRVGIRKALRYSPKRFLEDGDLGLLCAPERSIRMLDRASGREDIATQLFQVIPPYSQIGIKE